MCRAWQLFKPSTPELCACLDSAMALLQGRPLWNRYINSRIRRVEFNSSLPNLVCGGGDVWNGSWEAASMPQNRLGW
jgi:hypothetical protein